ncbi:MAG: kelch repeat-containing protein [Myxococcaceae bacterium]
MCTSARNVLVAAGVLLCTSACEPKVVKYQVRVVTSACTAPSPLEGATHLRFRVKGDGLAAPLERVSAITEAVAEIPDIPAGRGRTVEVRAYKGDPETGGTVVSVGRSVPFDVPDVVPDPANAPTEIAVFLRRVNSFTPPSLSESPTTCSRMLQPRAGHSATLLPDGRVFIAGGFNLESTDGERTFFRSTLASAEIFNPATGGFEEAPDIGVFNSQRLFTPMPRALHGALLLDNGQVLLAGGEVRNNNSYFATPSALIYDDEARGYGAFQMKSARIQPGAAKDVGGRVLIVGGFDTQGMPVATPEWYDPNKAFSSPDPIDPTRENPRSLSSIQVPRVGMSLAPVQDGAFIALAGGWDGAKLSDEVLFFSFDGSSFVMSSATARLRTARRGAGVARFGDENALLVVGGYSNGTEPEAALNTSEIITTRDAFNVAEGQPVSVPRGDICVAALLDGRVLTVGGRGPEFEGSVSSPAAEMMTPAPSGGATVLGMPALTTGRYYHTCTTLLDGSVLVLGGVEENTTRQRTLQDAWIFVPQPLD